MKTVLKLAAAAALVCTFAPNLARADSDSAGRSSLFPEPHAVDSWREQKPSLAVMLGYADTQEGRDGAVGYGVEYGWQPYIPFGAAVELSGYSANGSSNAAITRTRLLLKANYNFGGDMVVIKNSYVGVGIGPVWDNILGSSAVNFGVAPQVGFDIPLAAQYTLGANANYLFVGGAKPDVFAINGVAKYWF